MSLIVGGGQVGQTIDREVRDRLEMVRSIVMRTGSADAQRTFDLDSLDELIAAAAAQPCSSAACLSDEHAAVDDAAAATSAGWYWLCESPSGGGTT